MKTYEKYLNESKNELKNSYDSIDASMDLWLSIAKRNHPEAKRELKTIYKTWLNLDLYIKNFIKEFE